MKLSPKQKEIIQLMREKGKWKHPSGNDQNRTMRKLLDLKLVDWNDSFSYLILTELGKNIEL